MATYLIINVLFIMSVMLALRIRPSCPDRSTLTIVALLFTLTLIFDSLLVGLNIVGYDFSKTLGIQIGKAPIEDFFYTILSMMIVPVLWTKIGSKNGK